MINRYDTGLVGARPAICPLCYRVPTRFEIVLITQIPITNHELHINQLPFHWLSVCVYISPATNSQQKHPIMSRNMSEETPTLVGSSVRCFDDESHTASRSSSRQPNFRTVVEDQEKDYTSVNELVHEGALINDEQEYDQLLDETGKLKRDVPLDTPIPGAEQDEEEEYFSKIPAETKDSISLNQSIQKVQEDKQGPENEVVLVNIVKKQASPPAVLPAGPRSLYELGNNQTNDTSLEDLIDSQIASISEISLGMKQKKKKPKKRSSTSSPVRNPGNLILDRAVENDSPQLAATGAAEGAFSPLVQSRSQSTVRSPTSLQVEEKPHLASGDTYKGTEEFRLGRRPHREESVKMPGSSNDYLRSVSRSRTRMSSVGPSVSVGELANEGALLHDSEYNQQLEEAQNQFIDHADLKAVAEEEEESHEKHEVAKKDVKAPSTTIDLDEENEDVTEKSESLEMAERAIAAPQEEPIKDPKEELEAQETGTEGSKLSKEESIKLTHEETENKLDEPAATKSVKTTPDEADTIPESIENADEADSISKANDEQVLKTADETESKEAIKQEIKQPDAVDDDESEKRSGTQTEETEEVEKRTKVQDIDEDSKKIAVETDETKSEESDIKVHTIRNDEDDLNTQESIAAQPIAPEENKVKEDEGSKEKEQGEDKEHGEKLSEENNKDTKASEEKEDEDTEQALVLEKAQEGGAEADSVNDETSSVGKEEKNPVGDHKNVTKETMDKDSEEATDFEDKEPESAIKPNVSAIHDETERLIHELDSEIAKSTPEVAPEETKETAKSVSKTVEEPSVQSTEAEVEEDEEIHEPTKDEIIEMLKDEPVYIYTSLAGGGFHMPQRTNNLANILTANRIPFTYRDLGTDEEARNVWRRYSKGRLLPGIVRGKDDIIGNFQEIEEANENYRVRELIYETL